MPRYRVTFMNHIVETYEVEAPDEESAWKTPVWEVEERKPVEHITTYCEVEDVQLLEESPRLQA